MWLLIGYGNTLYFKRNGEKNHSTCNLKQISNNMPDKILHNAGIVKNTHDMTGKTLTEFLRKGKTPFRLVISRVHRPYPMMQFI